MKNYNKRLTQKKVKSKPNSYVAQEKSQSARDVALDMILRINLENTYIQLAVDDGLQQYKLKNEDRRLVTELVYGTFSHLLTIDYFLTLFVKIPLEKLDVWVKILLELSVYQIVYLDRIPEHAIVHEAVSIAKNRGHQGIAGMVNGVLRNVIRNQEKLVLPKNVDEINRISLSHSHPVWLVKSWIEQYGEKTTELICITNNEPPVLSIRVNTLKITREELITSLHENKIDARNSLLTKYGVIINYDGNIANHELYKLGFFSIQDESSMLVAEVLDPKPGMNVLDCCAAPGGKTTHLAELMHNTGQIWANDVHAHKQKNIEMQASRLGISVISTMVENACNLNLHFHENTFDRVLLDAPCSGLGVIRRKPDIKWRKSLEDIKEIASLQYELLRSAAKLVKPGGILVYSTCTIQKLENESIIQKFLVEHKSFTYDVFPTGIIPDFPNPEFLQDIGQVQILPHHYNSDGFFIVRLSKKLKYDL